MADGYTETFTPEEEAALAAPPVVPAAEPAAEPTPAPAPTPPTAPAPAAPVDGVPAAPAPTPAAPAQSDDERFAAFAAKHAGKSPEEIMRLAFQQEGRANQAGFTARQSQQTVDAIQRRMTDAATRAAALRDGAKTGREQFAEQLASDPDAAVRAVHERLMTADEAEAARIEHEARIENAVAVASRAIPDFASVAPQTYAFGAEMNYTPDELNAISDPRDLVTLHLASLSGRLLKAGVINMKGEFLQAPQPVAATDPRLTPPAAPATLSSAPARVSPPAGSTDQQLTDLANMTDKEWDAWMKANPGAVDQLLRQAN